jgi:hypothetical protein
MRLGSSAKTNRQNLNQNQGNLLTRFSFNRILAIVRVVVLAFIARVNISRVRVIARLLRIASIRRLHVIARMHGLRRRISWLWLIVACSATWPRTSLRLSSKIIPKMGKNMVKCVSQCINYKEYGAVHIKIEMKGLEI